MIRGVTGNDDHRSALDQALDVFVYLPVGFMFEVSQSIPRFIERGRQELHTDDEPAERRRAEKAAERRASDKLAGLLDPAARLERAQAHAVSTLRALGVLAPDEHEPGDRNGRTERLWEQGSVGTDVEPETGPAVGEPAVSGEPEAGPVSGEPVAGAGPDLSPDALAIPGYDSLSASQVMPRLESLTNEELELVRSYEHANRGRKTILNKIAQLQEG
jgi:hypothetical protein